MPDFRTKLERPLSPAAQAVFDAGDIGFATHREMIAAALRAAADQLKWEYPLSPEYTEWDAGHDAGIQRVINKIFAIADELEAQ